jgi:hypothetical protein
MSRTDPAGSGVVPFEPEHRASNENVVEGDGTGYWLGPVTALRLA